MKKRVAIVGGGITGACAARRLKAGAGTAIEVHLFDQGRRGVGGRTSSRSYQQRDGAYQSSTGKECYVGAACTSHSTKLRFDHGCQFFRADTPEFKRLAKEWIDKKYVAEWKGDFRSSGSATEDRHREFFGLPSSPPFYVAVDGMQSLPRNILSELESSSDTASGEGTTSSSSVVVRVHCGVRVAQMERDASTERHLLGGDNQAGFDAVILTDVSSSFGAWHRASAGVPEGFARRVRDRVGARVPLMTAMVAFERPTGVPFDAASFDHPVAWFAARTGSKPGMDTGRECWTVVSTPEYAMDRIEETPMQDPETGEFVPQTPGYLESVPGPDLLRAFEEAVCDKEGILGEEGALASLPEACFVDAQRWGSALPCHRHLRDNSEDVRTSTRRVLLGVPYDSTMHSLAPTQDEEDGASRSFVADDELALYQAGDMVSCYTPGMEGAALSGMDAADHVLARLNER
ncbi:hypothetical protein THAOC_20791 [Thalassiosira oceanica]|uniref:Amine oxidase domain-containing protein n=1 Tax=Thalassiosira oceanica TaxID=159749 RepID=K0S166_THAOC|nr:hypothetical protein THAOC_20791 [Thalassiosira oceanica]|eukprot:EJK59040.1 hypothetical protein THAOC_20791 [Thalassiosira oceanica]